MKIALTGHAPERLKGKQDKVFNWIETITLILFRDQEEKEVLCGMAKGADILFGQAALALFYPNEIKLHLCLPCKHYGEKNASYQYWELMDAAAEITYMQEEWSRGCDTLRDRYMVDNCDILLAVWDGIKAGGTYRTIQYAKSINKPIIYINKDIFK